MQGKFVPYEFALELKELGFDEECFAVYSEHDKTRVYDESFIKEGLKIPAPTWQDAFDFFRKKHAFLVGVYQPLCDKTHVVKDYYFEIARIGNLALVESTDDYETYEEARLACLKILIELVKNS